MSATSARGRVVRDDDGARLELVGAYAHPVGEVWAALTEPDRLARWIGTVTGDPATGAVELVMTEEGAAGERVAVVACEPPHRLVVDMGSPDGPWRLSLVLTARGSATELVLEQRLAEPYDATGIGPGWQYYLDRLGDALDHRPPTTAWADYHPALAAAYAVPPPPGTTSST